MLITTVVVLSFLIFFLINKNRKNYDLINFNFFIFKYAKIIKISNNRFF